MEGSLSAGARVRCVGRAPACLPDARGGSLPDPGGTKAAQLLGLLRPRTHPLCPGSLRDCCGERESRVGNQSACTPACPDGPKRTSTISEGALFLDLNSGLGPAGKPAAPRPRLAGPPSPQQKRAKASGRPRRGTCVARGPSRPDEARACGRRDVPKPGAWDRLKGRRSASPSERHPGRHAHREQGQGKLANPIYRTLEHPDAIRNPSTANACTHRDVAPEENGPVIPTSRALLVGVG